MLLRTELHQDSFHHALYQCLPIWNEYDKVNYWHFSSIIHLCQCQIEYDEFDQIYLWSSYGAKHSTTTSRSDLVSATHDTFLETEVPPFSSPILFVAVLFTVSWSLSPGSPVELKYQN